MNIVFINRIHLHQMDNKINKNLENKLRFLPDK